MAFVRLTFFLTFIGLLTACQTNKQDLLMKTASKDSISNQELDSLGEIAYDGYEYYAAEPEAFIAKLSVESLRAEQQETYRWILLNMAYNFLEHSRFLASATYYERALLLENKNPILSLEDRLNYLYKPLANLYSIFGEFGKSERLQLQAIQESNSAEIKAGFYNNLLLLYLHDGELLKAKQAGNKGLELMVTGNQNDKVRMTNLQVLLLNGLSKVFLAEENLDSAIYSNNQALQISSSIPLHTETAAGRISAISQQAELFLQKMEINKAFPLLKQAIQLEDQYFPKARFREKAVLQNHLGNYYFHKNKLNAAKSNFLKAKQLLEKQSSGTAVSNYSLVETYRNLAKVQDKSHIDSMLYYYSQSMEKEFAYQQNRSTDKDHFAGNIWNRKLMEEIFSEIGDISNLTPKQQAELLWLTEMAKGRLLWNDINRSNHWENDSTELAAAGKELQELYAKRDMMQDSSEINEINVAISKLTADFELEEKYFEQRRKIPSKEFFLQSLKEPNIQKYAYYIHENERISIFQVIDGRIHYQKVNMENLLPQIAAFKKKYFSQSPQAYNQNPKVYAEQAGLLGSELLPNLQKSIKTIQLSLDNELHVLPFEALMPSKKFLVMEHDVQYLHSLLTFELLKEKEFPKQELQVLYRQEYDPPLVDLPFVEKEVQFLNQHFNAKSYPFNKLDKMTLENIWKQKSIVHIAAHTVLQQDGKIKLMLQQPISTDQLRYFQISSSLVVLSACNTARGELLPSEGLASLNRTFISKGIPGVVATHWYANDAATLDLMAKFYEELSQSGSPVLAIAEAKRLYLLEQDDMGKNPWYWANMVYTGANTKIDLQQAAGLPPVFRWLASILTIILLYLLSYRLRKTDPDEVPEVTYNK